MSNSSPHYWLFPASNVIEEFILYVHAQNIPPIKQTAPKSKMEIEAIDMFHFAGALLSEGFWILPGA